MKQKIVYLPKLYSKDVVDSINVYFDNGYEIERTYGAEEGVYFLLVLKCNEIPISKYVASVTAPVNLIEEKFNREKVETWVSSKTQDVKFN